MPETKPALWISCFGIRVTDLERSLEFYNSLFDLEELARGGRDDSKYVLLRDKRSGQRLELNWYANNSPFAAPYIPGEGLDHIEVRVKSVFEMVNRLKKLGIPLATKKLWVNKEAIQRLPKDSKESEYIDKDVLSFPDGHNIVWIQDPDGNFIDFYDHPEEAWDGPIPNSY